MNKNYNGHQDILQVENPCNALYSDTWKINIMNNYKKVINSNLRQSDTQVLVREKMMLKRR